MYDVVVIGAGPSGLMASIKAASNHKKVLLIEKNEKVGKKLLLTGGGRCNLTNLKDVKSFIEKIPVNGKFLYSTLNNFGPKEIYDYFEKLEVRLKLEDHDRVFPTADDAGVIVEALLRELKKYNVETKYNTEVINISVHDDYKKIFTTNEVFQTRNIVIATGGASYPQTGSNGSGYKLASILNQPLIKIYPAETFLLLESPLPLAGLTLDNVVISFDNKQSTGSLLFTHRGLSGPATFEISEYVYEQLKTLKVVTIYINLLPDYQSAELLFKLQNYDSKKEIKTFIKQLLPNRLSDHLLDISNIDGSKKIAIISNKSKEQLIQNICKLPVEINRTGSIEQCLVTGGGVDLKYIDTRTMESTINKGIYYVGELIDFHGPTGGYNITIALSTGYTAGSNIK